MNNLIKAKSKNNQIQVLRAFFCFLVVFFHYTIRYSQIYDEKNVFCNSVIGYFAQVGVISFFILSGFYLNRRNVLKTTKEKVVYWIRRIFNIYIIYLFAITIIYIFSFTGLYGESRTVAFSTFIQNVFFVNVITGSGYVDGAHWYVFALLCLYMIAIAKDILSKKGQGYLFWVVILIISLFALFVTKYVVNDSIPIKILRILNQLLCQSKFPYAFVGVSLFYFDYEQLHCSKNTILVISVFAALTYIAIDDWICLIITLCSTFCVLLALARKYIFFERIKPMIILGNASYSIYLLHQNIGYMLIRLLKKVMDYYYALILTIVIILIVGVLFSVVVETNIKKLINKIVKVKQDIPKD